MNDHPIAATRVPTSQRASLASKLYGVRFLWIESFVFDTASSLSEEYDGGEWDYFTLSNGGFYMAPASGVPLRVACANGFEGSVSADAFGITACLYAFSFVSFSPEEEFGLLCANHYHWLRDYALQHVESKNILAALD